MIIKRQTHGLIKLVFINKVIACSPDCNIKKTQQGPNQSVVSCQTGKKWVEQDPVYKNSDNNYSEKLNKTGIFFLLAHVECWTAVQVKGVSYKETMVLRQWENITG